MPFQNNPVLKFLLSGMMPVLAALMQWQLWPILAPKTWIFFYPAVFFSSVVGGLVGGTMATCFAALLGVRFFMNPPLTSALDDVNNQISLFIFVGMGILFSLTFEYSNRTTKALQRHTENELEVGEIRLQHALKAANAGIWEWNTATDQLIWTDSLWRLLGLEPGSSRASYEGWLNTVHMDDRATVHDATQYAIENQTELNLEWRLAQLIDGKQRWLMSRGHPDPNNKGTQQIYRGIVIDITDRKLIDQELRESEKRIRLATETTGVGIWEWDVINNKIRWDSQMFRIYGVAPSSDGFVPYSTWSECVLPEELPQQEEIMNETIRRRGQNFREFQILRVNDRACRHIQAVETVRTNLDGQVEWVVGTNLDITDRRLSEEALRASERRWQFALEGSHQGVWDYDIAMGKVFFSAHWKAMLGYSDQQISDRLEEWSERVHPDDLAKIMETLNKHYRSEIPFYETEHRLRNRNGDYIWTRSRGMVISRSSTGEPLRMIGTQSDISEYRQLLDKLRDAENLARSIMDSLDMAIAVLDEQGTIIHINRFWEQLTEDKAENWAVQQSVGQNYYAGLRKLENIPDASLVLEELLAMSSGETPWFYREYTCEMDNITHWFKMEALPLLGTVSGLVTLHTDITKSKRIQLKLKEKERLLADAQAVAHVGSWMLDLKTGQLSWSDETFLLYGLSPETDITPGLEQFPALLHPEDRIAMQTWCEDCIAGKQPSGLEFRTCAINGQHRWLLGLGKLEMGSNGEPMRMIGTVQDITQQKLTEVVIKNNAASTQAILDTVVDGIITIDKSGLIKTFNPAAERIFGYEADEVIGRNIKMIMPEPFKSQHDGFLENYLTGGPAKIIGIGRIVVGLRKNGTTFPLDLAISETKLDEETLFTGIVRDITDRELANEKLKAAFSEKEVLLKEVYHRVKNNLQVVSSLINLQARNVENVEALSLLKQSADRIKAMALLHEKLYLSKDLAKIDFNDYVTSLVESLLNSFGTQRNQIQIKIDIQEVFLDLDTAIPCGLIINELLSNALKHAFPQGQQGVIEINFRQEQHELKLVFFDNGIGLPDGLDVKKCKSLGLQLVSRLTMDQLRGRLSLDLSKGACFSIQFLSDRSN